MMNNSDYQAEWLSSFGYSRDIKCTCGCDITFGQQCNKEFHSDWCEKSPNYKKDYSEDTFITNVRD